MARGAMASAAHTGGGGAGGGRGGGPSISSFMRNGCNGWSMDTGLRGTRCSSGVITAAAAALSLSRGACAGLSLTDARPTCCRSALGPELFAPTDDWRIGQSARREREGQSLPRSAPAMPPLSHMWGEERGGAGSSSRSQAQHPSLLIAYSHTPQQPSHLSALDPAGGSGAPGPVHLCDAAIAVRPASPASRLPPPSAAISAQ